MSLTKGDSHADTPSNPESSNNAKISNNAQPEGEDEEIVYQGHLKFGLLFAALCLSVFQVILVSNL
jgi:hypothetical protein